MFGSDSLDTKFNTEISTVFLVKKDLLWGKKVSKRKKDSRSTESPLEKLGEKKYRMDKTELA